MTTLGAEELESPLARSADDASTLAFTMVVPTYGHPEGLRACLESLATQRYPGSRFEVIIIDDGSAIPAVPIAASYDDRLQIRVRRQANAGPAAARNHGGMSARGSYIAFLDDDCGRFRLQFLWFYLFVLQACLASKRQLLRKAALVFLWQACNVAGFVAAFLSERRGAATHQYAS